MVRFQRANFVGRRSRRPGMRRSSVVDECWATFRVHVSGRHHHECHDAVLVGWEALSEAMRVWGIRTREDLSEWIHRQGFPRPRWGAHFSGRVQERILTMAATVDVRVSALEAVYVQVALLACRQVPLPVEPILHEAVRGILGQRPAFPESFPEECWSIMDEVNLQELFQFRFPVLQSCPHHVRWRFRQANRGVLEARHEAVRSRDTVMEER